MGEITGSYSGSSQGLSQKVDRLLSFPGIDPDYLVRIRTYWIMVVGAAVFVFFLTLLVWALGSKTLIWNGIVLLGGYTLIAIYIILAKRPILWIGVVGQVFTIVVTFATIAILGGLFQSGGIITAAIAAVLFSMFLLRPAWTFYLFVLFCVLLIATPFIPARFALGADLTPFANALLYVINTLWISGFMVFFVISFMRERAQAEEEKARRLKELDSAKTRFYTNISHEFRTPLTIISGMAEQISEHPERWLGEGLDMIRHNSRRILSLVNQMLELSKLDAGKMQLQLRQSDVVAYLRYLAGSFRSYAESRELHLHFETKVPELIMDFDPDRLGDIISNLLSNAFKFTPAGGSIYLQVQAETSPEPVLLICVKDTGPGIAATHLPFIFDRFYRGDSGENTAGSGIGLSLAKSLAQIMGGDITVRSSPGQGAEFMVQLPVARNAPAADQPVTVPALANTAPMEAPALPGIQHPADSADVLEKPMVLLVDDYPDILQFLEATLSHLYSTISAANGREGLEKALAFTPDLIISDVMMPEMDGMTLCRHLKNNSLTSHIPVVLLTARADEASHLEGLENRADAYIAKPFSHHELLLTLRNLLAGRSALRRYYLAAAGLDAGEPATGSAPAISPIDEQLLHQLHQSVMARLDDADLHVEDLCRSLGMSHAQLHRKLIALTGMGANRYIRTLRLHEAASMLRSPERNVTEVAFDTGFRDPDYFGRAFRKMFGMSPSEYRAAWVQ